MLLRLLALLALCIALTVCEDTDIDDSSEPIESFSKGVVKIVVPLGKAFFQEQFIGEKSKNRWIESAAKKIVMDGAKREEIPYDGKFRIKIPHGAFQDDFALILTNKAHHHAISAKLDEPFNFLRNSPLIVQYEVKFNSSLECGGAYIKLLSHSNDLDLTQFFDKTPFTIMFGPDKCGGDKKCHFIVRYKNPKTGEYHEHNAENTSKIPETIFSDGQTHLFKLVLERNHNYKIYIDNNVFTSGSLLHDMDPPILPPKEIVDKTSVKPEDWDDREEIRDPNAQKPDDWDESEPRMIPDINAVKPNDWLEDEPKLVPDESVEPPSDYDEEIDGKWEPPLIPNKKCQEVSGCGKWSPPMIENPKYKGPWSAPFIKNPAFKGVWKPDLIPNPDYFEEKDLYSHLDPISAIGLELWSMNEDIIFDNFLITSDNSVARQFAEHLWRPKTQGKLLSSKTVESFFKAAGERPWLYALYVLLVFVPLVLAISFYKRKRKPTVVAVDHKKTDDVVPDDKVTDVDEEQEDSPAPMAKSDLGVSAGEEEVLSDDGGSPSKRKSRARKET